jgi:hypothetical protein
VPVVARYPYFGAPPTHERRPASNEPALAGKRVILSTPDGFIHDMRAVSEVQTDGAGGAIVCILTELHYFEQMYTSRRHQSVAWPAYLVWVD